MGRVLAREALKFTLIMFSMAACIPLFFLGPMAYQSGLSLGQALAAAFIGNAVVAVAIALNGRPGTVEGVDFVEQAVRTYGRTWGRVVVALRGLVGALWYGVEAFNGALALVLIALYILHSNADPLRLVPVALAGYVALLALALARGVRGISLGANIAGPLLLAYFAWLYLWLERHPPAQAAGAAQAGVPWLSSAFLVYLAIQTNWWATVAVNASDLTRSTRSWAAVWAGVLLGLVGGQVLGTYLGYQLAAATGEVLPHDIIMKYSPGAAAVVLGLAFVFLAPWTTDLTANAPALADLIKALTGAGWRRAALAAAAAGMVLAPWWALDRAQDIVGYVASFAASYGVILGPILGPMLAWYWIDRRGSGLPAFTAALIGVAAGYAHSILAGDYQTLDLAGLKLVFPSGPAWYTGVAASILAYLALARLAPTTAHAPATPAAAPPKPSLPTARQTGNDHATS